MRGDGPAQHEDARFTTTRWALIATARGRDPNEARLALAELCRSYWYPIYVYIRRRGHPADLASDLTQEFFAAWIERDLLGSVAPERGRFRSFLLAACRHFLANRREHDGALKRGGGQPVASLDLRDAEGRYLREPSHDLGPERLFERRWALTVLESALDRLSEEMVRAGKGPLFERLAAALPGGGEAAPYARVATDLGMTEGAIKAAAHRLRGRFRELLVEEVAGTVDSREEVDGEIRDLFHALGR